MAQLKSPKQATKGIKQIVDENGATLAFYRNMILTSSFISLLILIFYYSSFAIASFIYSCVVYICAYKFMEFMSRASYSDSGQLIDSGVDLNMEGGVAEHIKDVIILTAICQTLSAVISNYFWYLWLVAPCRVIWLLWNSVLSPFYQGTAQEPDDIDEKKRRKLERKMKRAQNVR